MGRVKEVTSFGVSWLQILVPVLLSINLSVLAAHLENRDEWTHSLLGLNDNKALDRAFGQGALRARELLLSLGAWSKGDFQPQSHP